MSNKAYALREEYAETFAGATYVDVGTGGTVDVKELLEASGGVIVTSDSQLMAHLDESHVFKGVAKSEATGPVIVNATEPPETVDPDAYTKDQLLDLAEDEGVEVGKNDSKAELAAAIDEARLAAASEGSD